MLKVLLSSCVLAAGVAASGALHAQVRLSDVPDSFFSAQRGRVVAGHHGGFRIHYGRGLTPQGAEVFNNAITTVIPQVFGFLGAPGNAPGSAPPAAPPAGNTSNAPGPCADAETENALSAISDVGVHRERLTKLDSIDKELAVLLDKYKLPHAVKREEANKTDSVSDAGIDVTKSGGKIFMPDKPLSGQRATAGTSDAHHRLDLHIYLHIPPAVDARPTLDPSRSADPAGAGAGAGAGVGNEATNKPPTIDAEPTPAARSVSSASSASPPAPAAPGASSTDHQLPLPPSAPSQPASPHDATPPRPPAAPSSPAPQSLPPAAGHP